MGHRSVSYSQVLSRFVRSNVLMIVGGQYWQSSVSCRVILQTNCFIQHVLPINLNIIERKPRNLLLLLVSAIFSYYLLSTAICCYLLLFAAIYCYLLLFTAIYCYLLLFTAIYCYLLLFTAIYCYLLLFTAIYY
jgi:hypothetical protein